MNINYVEGSALEPIGGGNKIIAHVCNNMGAWGAGFVMAISKKWKAPETIYRSRHYVYNLNLGEVQHIQVQSDIYISNMIAQTLENVRPLDDQALETCLFRVAALSDKIENASVHMPRIGCGLAGGKWKEIEPIIQKTLIKNNIPTYVYTLPGDKSWR